MPEWLKDWLRGWLLFLGALAAFGYFAGVPHVLNNRTGVGWYGSPVWTHCHYLGPFGWVVARPGYDVYEECPAFALLDWRLALLGEGRE